MRFRIDTAGAFRIFQSRAAAEAAVAANDDGADFTFAIVVRADGRFVVAIRCADSGVHLGNL
jgi:hypothetical protein